MAGGSRFRAAAPQEVLDQAPVEALDFDLPGLIHWWSSDSGGGDPLAGARWALSWSLSLIFGDTVGALLEQATLENVERWNGSAWTQVA